MQLSEMFRDDAGVGSCERRAVSQFFVGSTWTSSVIVLTEAGMGDAHDYGAPRLRRIETRSLATLCKASMLLFPHAPSEFFVAMRTEPRDRPPVR